MTAKNMRILGLTLKNLLKSAGENSENEMNTKSTVLLSELSVLQTLSP